MPFEFHLPSLEEMRATSTGLEMLRMVNEDNFRSALISGVPGSGKTTVSIQRFVRLNNQHANVHLITYQKLLVLAIQNLVHGKAVPRGRVSTFHQWYWRITHTFFNTAGDNNQHETSSEEMIRLCERAHLVNQGIDEMLIDEGQDLPRSVYEVIPRYTKRFFVGADDNQQVHTHGASVEVIESSLRQNYIPFQHYDLGQNFRNTYETYRFARQFIPRDNHIAWDPVVLDRLLHSNRRGRKPTIISYCDINSRNKHLQTTLNNAEGNVAILCPLGPVPGYIPLRNASVDEIYQLITDMGFNATKYHNGTPLPLDLERYVVTTFKSAKGMEFDTVIIPRINFHHEIPKEWYVACTRAKDQIFIYRDLTNPDCDASSRFDSDTYDPLTLEATPSVASNDLPF